MSSRDPADLAPEFRRRLHFAVRDYRARHGEAPRLIFSATWRSGPEQTREYAKGRTAPGPISTNAQAGESPHNIARAGRREAEAVDVAFVQAGNVCDWTEVPFRRFAAVATPYGFVWGGKFRRPDGPHFQAPGFDEWLEAGRRGDFVPTWPAMPEGSE